MRDVKFRCSSIGKLMGEPKAKGEVLTQTAKAYVRQVAAEAIFGVDFEVSSKQMEKGIVCEGESIALFNRVYGRALTKNTERRSDEFFQGESDLPDTDEVIDIKTAWSIATFPLSEDDIADAQRKLYEFQLRAYMRLWDKPRGRLAYCLVNTPEELIGYEPMSLHFIDHIPAHLRVTTWVVERDAAIEAQMVAKVLAARRYYAEVIAEFDRTHRLDVIAPAVKGAEPASPAALAVTSTILPADLFAA